MCLNQNLFLEYAVNSWKNDITNKEMVYVISFLLDNKKNTLI